MYDYIRQWLVPLHGVKGYICPCGKQAVPESYYRYCTACGASKVKRIVLTLPHIGKAECVLDKSSLDALICEANILLEEDPGTTMIATVKEYTLNEIVTMPEFEGW